MKLVSVSVCCSFPWQETSTRYQDGLLSPRQLPALSPAKESFCSPIMLHLCLWATGLALVPQAIYGFCIIGGKGLGKVGRALYLAPPTLSPMGKNIHSSFPASGLRLCYIGHKGPEKWLSHSPALQWQLTTICRSAPPMGTFSVALFLPQIFLGSTG